MRRVLAVLAVTLVTAACTIMNDLHLDQVQQPETPGDDDDSTPVKDGGTITLADGNVIASACKLKRPPGPPTGVKPGGADVSITVAMVNMASEPTGPKIGFDQDGLCTCLENAPEACKVKPGAKHCDPDDKTGLDNASGELFRSLANGAVKINIIEDANFRVQTGNHGNVFRIEGYNGQDDDDDVKVTYWPSPGLGTAPDSTKVQTWPVGPAVPGGKAYVAKRQLVAQFAKIEVFFLDDTNVPAFMENATLTGEITKGATPTLGTSILYGRVNTTAMVQSVGQLAPQATFETPLCQAQINGVRPYTAIASGACAQSDLPATAAMDSKGDQPCSSISMGLELRLTPAVVGNQASIFRPSDRCSDQTPIVCE